MLTLEDVCINLFIHMLHMVLYFYHFMVLASSLAEQINTKMLCIGMTTSHCVPK